MRLLYINNALENLTPPELDNLRRIQARREDQGLLPLYLAPLHAPKVADGWQLFFGSSVPMLCVELLEIAMSSSPLEQSTLSVGRALCRFACSRVLYFRKDGSGKNIGCKVNGHAKPPRVGGV